MQPINKIILKRFSSQLAFIKKVGVVGAGQMGVGIGLVAASLAKRQVVLLDYNAGQLQKSLKFIGTF